MNTTANIQVYPMTPYAFKHTKREDFLQNLSIKTRKMIKNKDIRQRKKRQLLNQLFNVQIKGGNLQNISIKQCIQHVLKQMQLGKNKCDSIQEYIRSNQL